MLEMLQPVQNAELQLKEAEAAPLLEAKLSQPPLVRVEAVAFVPIAVIQFLQTENSAGNAAANYSQN